MTDPNPWSCRRCGKAEDRSFVLCRPCVLELDSEWDINQADLKEALLGRVEKRLAAEMLPDGPYSGLDGLR